MFRYLMASMALVLAAVPARAHFIWIVPAGDQGEIMFSEKLEPDQRVLKKIAGTQWFVRHPDGKTETVKWVDGRVPTIKAAGKKPHVLTGICDYGVLQRGKDKPFLLQYYAAAPLGIADSSWPGKLAEPWENLPLQILPARTAGQVQVFWQGKPLAEAEVVFVVPGKDEPVSAKTNKAGLIALPADKSATGLVGIRARHVESRAGKQDGKDYQKVRHYATLVVKADSKETAKPKEDPEASKLLKEARAARAQWDDFPGFTADVEVNFDGKFGKGTLKVDAHGKLHFDKLDKEMLAWAKDTLGSVVFHRLDRSASRNTPCCFTDKETNHPLGRAIRVLTDELHSSYRVGNRQILEVNRQMPGMRFSISMLENRTNPAGKFLPVSFVVDTWDLASGKLKSSQAWHQTWVRVGQLDLPASVTNITASGKEPPAKDSPAMSKQVRRLTLARHKLLAKEKD